MTRLRLPPWHKLIELSGGKGVKAEWKDFPSELLSITDELALAIPCKTTSGCYSHVVHHGPEDIVGICTSEDQPCERRKLCKAELAIYRINHRQLAEKISEAIGFTAQLEEIKGQASLWKLGVLNPQAEQRFSVFCCLGQTTSQVEKVLHQLCMTQTSPFILVIAVSSIISHACLEISDRHQSKLLSMDDVLGVNIAGEVLAKLSIQAVIQRWLGSVVPKPTKPGSEYQFPTPAGARWEAFVFEFIATEMLLVSCGKVQERLEPEHLKMKNQKTGRATLQWILLHSLATTGGQLSWEDHHANDRLKKQKQALADKLKQTFQLPEDPIPWCEYEKCYKSRFVVKGVG